MAEQFENSYSTLLNGAINSSVTTLTVDAVPLTMTGNFRIKIGTEIILVGTVSGLTFTGCTRGVEGTTAASHADNAVVNHPLTSAALVSLKPYLDTLPLHSTHGDDFGGSSLNTSIWTPQGAFSSDVAIYADGGSWLRHTLRGSTATSIWQSAPVKETFEVIVGMSQFGVGGNIVGPAMASSTGTGISVGFRVDESIIRMDNITSYAFSSTGSTTSVGTLSEYTRGIKHWWSMRVIPTTSDGVIYITRYSTDGFTWSKELAYKPTAFTMAKIGWGRFYAGTSEDVMSIDRFNVVSALDVGDDLVVTPTSGTATKTASSNFGGGFVPASAGDGNSATEWAAATGNTDAPLYWQCAWSVGQTLNRVLIRERNGDVFGIGHLELFDGTTTTKVPIRGFLSGGARWHVVDFSTLTGITQLKVVSDGGGGANAGFSEVEVYLRS